MWLVALASKSKLGIILPLSAQRCSCSEIVKARLCESSRRFGSVLVSSTVFCIMSLAFALMTPFGVDFHEAVRALLPFSFTSKALSIEFLFQFRSHHVLGIHAVHSPVTTLFVHFVVSKGSFEFRKGHLFLLLHDHGSESLIVTR